MASVQFRNIDSVLMAYRDRDVPAWAMFQGKQFLFSYSGSDIIEGEEYLRKILEMISESAAIYTICIYEDLPTGKIKSNTPHDGSFNFRLNEYEPSQRMISGVSSNYALEKKVEDLSNKLDMLLNEEEEPEQENNLIGQINQIMEIPGVKELAMSIAGMFIKPQPQPVAGAINGPEEGKLNQALSALMEMGEAAPILIDKMIRLNEIRKENPKLFETYISYLQMIQ